jgi:hypothetical protein
MKRDRKQISSLVDRHIFFRKSYYLYSNYNKCERAKEEVGNMASRFADFMYHNKEKNKNGM